MSNVSASSLPPNSKLTLAALVGVSEEKTFAVSAEASQRAISNSFFSRFGHFFSEPGTCNQFYAYNTNIRPRLQDGPTCGLVALRMAAEALGAKPSSSFDTGSLSTPGSLLELAQWNGYSGKGEMFNSYHMSALAEEYYPSLKAEVLDCESWPPSVLSELISSVVSGSIALVPYDSDKNGEPAVKLGQSAHWAVIKGFILPINEPDCWNSLVQTLNQNGNKLEENGLTLILNQDSPHDTESAFAQDLKKGKYLEENNVVLIAQQARSKFQTLWKYSSLKDSNNALLEPDIARTQDQAMIVPKTLKDLQHKLIILRKKS